ncbi:DMT family transporter [Streptomyces odontomachi]|uniref:DMT family transporter n=1 Tax=Streptomyces odontomachi TaxID=2944940 RepID=UPI00210BBC6F|nr:DMT family transporter [Streptomyces sp. ODS25]
MTEDHTTDTAAARERALGYLALAASTIGIGSALIFVRLSEVDPTSTLMLRMVVASVLVGAVTVPRGGGTSLRDVRPRDLTLLVVSSLVAGLDLLANQWSVHFTAVANTAFLMNLSPVFVLLLTWLVLRQSVALAKQAIVLVAIAGGVLVVMGGADRPAIGPHHFFGDALALSSAACYAIFLLMTKHLRERIPTTLIMITNSLVMTVMLLPLALLTSDPILPHSFGGYTLIVVYALVAQLVGHGLMTYALRVVDAGLASMSALLRPVVTTVLAWVVLDEAVGALQVVGGVVILAALCGFQVLDARRRTDPSAAPVPPEPGPVPEPAPAPPPATNASAADPAGGGQGRR